MPSPAAAGVVLCPVSHPPGPQGTASDQAHLALQSPVHGEPGLARWCREPLHCPQGRPGLRAHPEVCPACEQGSLGLRCVSGSVSQASTERALWVRPALAGGLPSTAASRASFLPVTVGGRSAGIFLAHFARCCLCVLLQPPDVAEWPQTGLLWPLPAASWFPAASLTGGTCPLDMWEGAPALRGLSGAWVGHGGSPEPFSWQAPRCCSSRLRGPVTPGRPLALRASQASGTREPGGPEPQSPV